MEMIKTGAKMKNSIYLDLLISVINKIKIHEFWYDYVKVKYDKKKKKLCYMDTDKIIVQLTTESIFHAGDCCRCWYKNWHLGHYLIERITKRGWITWKNNIVVLRSRNIAT